MPVTELLDFLDAPPLSRRVTIQPNPQAAPWDQFAQGSVGLPEEDWGQWFLKLQRIVKGLQGTGTALTGSLGTLANAPTLGAGGAGYLYYVTDFAHWVRWTGTAWEFTDGGNRFFADFEFAPGTGWALCDGSTVTYLTVGATLGTASIMLPNSAGSPAYRKSGAAYTGAIVAAVAPGLSGSTADATASISGSTTADPPDTDVAFAQITVDQNLDGTTATVPRSFAPTPHVDIGSFSVGVGTFAVDLHQHLKGTLAVDATAEPARLVTLPFFRR